MMRVDEYIISLVVVHNNIELRSRCSLLAARNFALSTIKVKYTLIISQNLKAVPSVLWGKSVLV